MQFLRFRVRCKPKVYSFGRLHHDAWITGKSEVNCCNQAIAQLCAFCSPFSESMSDRGYVNRLIRSCKTGSRGDDTGILWLPVTYRSGL